MKVFAGIALGVVASLAVARVVGHRNVPAHERLVAEDASAPLRRIAIHYAPKADRVALAIWKQLFAVLPARVDVEVEVAAPADFDRFMRELAGTPNPERFHPVIVGAPITTWSRDRYAALDDEILAPPRVEAAFADRAGDSRSPAAISEAMYHRAPRVAGFAFEGGDLAATPRFVFADANLAARNLGRGGDVVDRAAIEHELHQRLAQELIWLGDAPGEVPQHHIMMYMVPLDDATVAVGDIRAGLALLAHEPAGAELDLDDAELQARRFDRAAELIAARGFHVVRFPALVLEGGGAFVTYTNALFDQHSATLRVAARPGGAGAFDQHSATLRVAARPGGAGAFDQHSATLRVAARPGGAGAFDRGGATRVVYLPTYGLPALDRAAAQLYAAQGFEVHPIDVSSIYRLDGSLGCLVNVLARG
jgi:hypothetical protein